MSAIFGIVSPGGEPVSAVMLQKMHQALLHWGPDGGGICLEREAGFGAARLHNSPEALNESVPFRDAERHMLFTASARLDNRDELLRTLGVSSGSVLIPDSDLIYQAYLRWGDACVEHLFGDWAFAVWDEAQKRLFLARDQLGNTGLYYYTNPQFTAFASDRRALLALGAPQVIDDFYLAQLLTSWYASKPGLTIYKSIQRLPCAHTLVITPERMATQRYWSMKNLAIVRMARQEDYVAAFSHYLDEAVRVRLRTAPGYGIAASLSGGLDSSSIAVTAARLLQPEGVRLTAFTSTPIANPALSGLPGLIDELPLAKSIARYSGNIDVIPVRAEKIGIMSSLRWALEIFGEPVFGSGNMFWIFDLLQTVRDSGCRTLLTGQMGNFGLSKTGNLDSQPVWYQLRCLGLIGWAKQQIKHLSPVVQLRRYKNRLGVNPDWTMAAVHPDLAKRAGLRIQQPLRRFTAGNEATLILTLLERSPFGAIWNEHGAAFGLDVRDPSSDVRLLEFIFSVPDDVFIDPYSDLDRWLIRAAMEGQLPDEVRLNRRRGIQAGDLIFRLRSEAPEIEEALNQFERGPAAAYLNVSYMRKVWKEIQEQVNLTTNTKAQAVMMRGLMTGLFLNQ